MKNLPKIYRDAALKHLDPLITPHRVENYYHPCNAIAAATNSGPLKFRALDLYADFFGEGKGDEDVWFPDYNYTCDGFMQEHRCLCLLLMAEIAADL